MGPGPHRDRPGPLSLSALNPAQNTPQEEKNLDFLTAHPVTIALAAISAVIWTMGNRKDDKRLVIAGILLSLAAVAAFVFGK